MIDFNLAVLFVCWNNQGLVDTISVYLIQMLEMLVAVKVNKVA